MTPFVLSIMMPWYWVWGGVYKKVIYFLRGATNVQTKIPFNKSIIICTSTTCKCEYKFILLDFSTIQITIHSLNQQNCIHMSFYILTKTNGINLNKTITQFSNSFKQNNYNKTLFITWQAHFTSNFRGKIISIWQTKFDSSKEPH